MVRDLLVCGLVAGACGGLLATGFAVLAGEPAVNQAIAYEEAHAPPPAAGAHEQEVVSRGAQRSFGLLTASTVYGLALGGLFALVFAAVYGRVARTSPARTALWLAVAAFVVVYAVPFVKYPPNPPAVGDPHTIGERTLLYLSMVAISILGAVAAVRLRRIFRTRLPQHRATPLAGASYLTLVVVAGLALPGIHEVPHDFPAETLWDFREASAGMQAVMWATIGLAFATLAQRVMSGRPIWSRGSRSARFPAAAGD